MSSVPLQRSLMKARKEGCHVAIVERYVPFPKPYGHRVDMFGLFDAVSVRSDVTGVRGIQACRGGDVAAHLDKTREPAQAEVLAVWKAAGNTAVIWGWEEKVRRNEDGSQARLASGAIDRRKFWTCREIVL